MTLSEIVLAHAKAAAAIEGMQGASDGEIAAAVAQAERLEAEIVRSRTDNLPLITQKLKLAVERKIAEHGDLDPNWLLIESALLDLTAVAVSDNFFVGASLLPV